MEKMEPELYQTRMEIFLLPGHWILQQHWRLVNNATWSDLSFFIVTIGCQYARKLEPGSVLPLWRNYSVWKLDWAHRKWWQPWNVWDLSQYTFKDYWYGPRIYTDTYSVLKVLTDSNTSLNIHTDTCLKIWTNIYMVNIYQYYRYWYRYW